VSYRAKVIVFFFSALALFLAAAFAYSTSQTLSRLDQVEAGRDQWQRPAEVLATLNLKSGDSAVDLGCGSGYFSLRLSQPVGSTGRVIAEDIRSLPLIFLWLRTHLKHLGNISIVRGEPADPQLPSASVTAVLIANTYHELTDAQSILSHVKQSLVSGGRLVVVDRAPNPVGNGNTGAAEHEISSERVERELRQAGFELVSRVDRFIPKDPDNESWWLIVARKP
jgi:predicted methyltransferase